MDAEFNGGPGRPPVNRTRWAIHLALVAAYILIAAVASLFRANPHRPALSHSASGLLAVCVVQLSIFAAFVGTAFLASRPSKDDLLLRWRGKFIPVLLGAGYSISLRIAVGLVSVLVGAVILASGMMSQNGLREYLEKNRPGVENVVDIAALQNNPVYFWLTITVVSFIVAGVREELWRSSFLAGLRMLWPRHFTSKAGEMGAVAIAAFVFGLAHLSMGPLAAFMAGVLGLGLGWIMVFHRSIWPAAFAHGFFDATSMALLPYAFHAMQQLPHH